MPLHGPSALASLIMAGAEAGAPAPKLLLSPLVQPGADFEISIVRDGTLEADQFANTNEPLHKVINELITGEAGYRFVGCFFYFSSRPYENERMNLPKRPAEEPGSSTDYKKATAKAKPEIKTVKATKVVKKPAKKQ